MKKGRMEGREEETGSQKTRNKEENKSEEEVTEGNYRKRGR